MRRVLLTLLALTVLGTVLRAQTLQLQVACAADLQPVMPTLAAAYEHTTGVHLVTAFGSSATLAQQLANGAPQDVFLSADTVHPQQLIDNGIGIGPTPTPYARGVLALWALKTSPLQPISLDTLKNPRLTRLAIANPAHAPYGLAAQQALQHLGLYAQLRPKLAIAENIAQTAQFVETGAADIGIIALSLAQAPAMKDKGKYWPVPLDPYPTLDQGGVILSWAKDMDATQQFKSFVTSADGKAILQHYGFVLPGE